MSGHEWSFFNEFCHDADHYPWKFWLFYLSISSHLMQFVCWINKQYSYNSYYSISFQNQKTAQQGKLYKLQAVLPNFFFTELPNFLLTCQNYVFVCYIMLYNPVIILYMDSNAAMIWIPKNWNYLKANKLAYQILTIPV